MHITMHGSDERLNGTTGGWPYTLIPDPYLGFNDRDQAWIGQVDWRDTPRFDLPGPARDTEPLVLVCQGLDGSAQVKGYRYARVIGYHLG